MVSFRVDNVASYFSEQSGHARPLGVDARFDVVITAGGELVERGGFRGEHLVDDGVERAGGDQCGDGDGAGLCDAVDAVFGLGDEGGCPFGFHEEGVLGAREGEADSRCGDLCDEHVYLARLKGGHGGVVRPCWLPRSRCALWRAAACG